MFVFMCVHMRARVCLRVGACAWVPVRAFVCVCVCVCMCVCACVRRLTCVAASLVVLVASSTTDRPCVDAPINCAKKDQETNICSNLIDSVAYCPRYCGKCSGKQSATTVPVVVEAVRLSLFM